MTEQVVTSLELRIIEPCNPGCNYGVKKTRILYALHYVAMKGSINYQVGRLFRGKRAAVLVKIDQKMRIAEKNASGFPRAVCRKDM